MGLSGQRDLAEPDAAAVLREINGCTVADGKLLKSFQELKDDGSTACGGWMYTGVFPDQHDNRSVRASRTALRETAAIRVGLRRGRTIVAPCTTAPPPTRRETRGRTGRR